MTWKQFDRQLTEALFAPLAILASWIPRTEYRLAVRNLTIKRPFRKPLTISLDELDEIGVETTDQGPFVEDVFWILKSGRVRLSIGQPHPIFPVLMDRFETLEGFDWKLFCEAMACGENRYFQCWKKPPESLQT